MLEAARGRNCILVSPLPRYLKAGCCQDVEHMANRGTEGFERQLLQDLMEMADNQRDFTFTAGYRQFKILDPMVSWRALPQEEVWATDPTHPTAAAYKKIAVGVIHLNMHMESGAKKRARTNSFETGDGPRNLANPRSSYSRSGVGGGGSSTGGGGGRAGSSRGSSYTVRGGGSSRRGN
jgi:hypothetical protein